MERTSPFCIHDPFGASAGTDVSDLVESLSSRPGVLNMIVLEGVARNPDGDSVQFDVIAAKANDVLHDLRASGVAQRGSIIIEDVGADLSNRGTEAEAYSRRTLAVSAQAVTRSCRRRHTAGGSYVQRR